ncbi:MAG: hypothetical protein WAK11_13765 [Candidatus Cybelea sp.]
MNATRSPSWRRIQHYLIASLTLSIVLPTAAGAQQANTNAPLPLASPSAGSSPRTIVVPGGTTVVVSLAEPISSATANVNDQVAVIVKKQVVVDGWIVVPLGANGHATVTAVEHAASNGSGGKLSMSVDWVYSADGGMIQLSTTNHASESGDAKGAASTATLLSWVFLGPLGFFAHNFVRGRDVTIGTDKSFTVFVDHAVHVRAMQQTVEGQAFDH